MTGRTFLLECCYSLLVIISLSSAKVDNLSLSTLLNKSEDVLSENRELLQEDFSNLSTKVSTPSASEVQNPYATPSPPWTQCSNGHGYRSLAECKTACNFGNQGSVAASAQQETVTHKLIILKSDEYIIDNNYVITPHLTTNDFVIKNGVVELCYRLQEKFVFCHKRCVSMDEVNATDEHGLLIGSSEVPYEFDDFYLVNNSDGNCVGAAICETGTTFIIFPTVCLVFSTTCVWMVVFMNFVFPNEGCNRVLLYHLMTLATGYVITAVKSVTTLYYSYYLPTDECMVLSTVQEFCFLVSCLGININLRKIYLLMRQDISQSMIPGNNYSRRKQQLYIIFRFSALMLWLIFGLFTFVTELLPAPGTFFPEFIRLCENYRKKHRKWFITYYSWMVYTLFSNIVLFIVITKRFYRWNNTMNNNTNSIMTIPRLKVLSRSFVHLMILLLIIMLYWSCVNFIVPWDTTTSVVSGVIEMSKAVQGVFLFLLYIRLIRLRK